MFINERNAHIILAREFFLDFDRKISARDPKKVHYPGKNNLYTYTRVYTYTRIDIRYSESVHRKLLIDSAGTYIYRGEFRVFAPYEFPPITVHGGANRFSDPIGA